MTSQTGVFAELFSWSALQKDTTMHRCCAHFQKGCPQTTLSPMKCETPCTLKGQPCTKRYNSRQHDLLQEERRHVSTASSGPQTTFLIPMRGSPVTVSSCRRPYLSVPFLPFGQGQQVLAGL